jgi:methylglutaconyl-CoA hydratase
MEPYVNRLTDNRGVCTITFFHPQSNSLPGVILRLLAKTIRDVGTDDEVKVIVLKSGGDRAFCAGASFDELTAIKDADEGKTFFSGFAEVINACRTCPKLIIGRVQGKAVGGGIGVASSVDYCLATKYAAIKLSELSIGIGPFVVGPAVERKLGTSAFSELAIDASSWRSAEWAKARGLYADVFESATELDAAVDELAGRLAEYNPEAMKNMKMYFWKGTEHWDDMLEERAAMSGKLVLSDFTREAIARFKEG